MRRPGLVVVVAVVLAGCGGTSPMAPSPTPIAASPSPSPSPTAAATPTPAATPSPDPGPTVLRTARIRGAAGHAASGTARIVREGGRYRLELLSDFRIDSDNNDVYLARQAETVGASDLNLGAMKSTRGAQSYDLPDAGGSYSHVVLWCRPFRIPIGVGELQ